jgi:hypothetical protein
VTLNLFGAGSAIRVLQAVGGGSPAKPNQMVVNELDVYATPRLPMTVNYTYDDSGLMTGTQTSDQFGLPIVAEEIAYGAGNRVASYVRSNPATIIFIYTPTGNRIARLDLTLDEDNPDGRWSIYDGRTDIVKLRRLGDGEYTLETAEVTLGADGTRVMQIQFTAPPARLAYLIDGAGTIQMLVTVNPATLEPVETNRMRRSMWGERLEQDGEPGTPFTGPSQWERDEETGRLEEVNRWYDARTGTFAQPASPRVQEEWRRYYEHPTYRTSWMQRNVWRPVLPWVEAIPGLPGAIWDRYIRNTGMPIIGDSWNPFVWAYAAYTTTVAIWNDATVNLGWMVFTGHDLLTGERLTRGQRIAVGVGAGLGWAAGRAIGAAVGRPVGAGGASVGEGAALGARAIGRDLAWIGRGIAAGYRGTVAGLRRFGRWVAGPVGPGPRALERGSLLIPGGRGPVQGRGPLSLGSTADPARGSILPRNLRELAAAESALADPTSGRMLRPVMGDPRWPHSAGWRKMEAVFFPHTDRQIVVHYVYNVVTGAVDDPKIILAGTRFVPFFP